MQYSWSDVNRLRKYILPGKIKQQRLQIIICKRQKELGNVLFQVED